MGKTPRIGDVVGGRFMIEHLAGTGGMGQVYRARDRRTGGPVALKVMHDAELLETERFAREARVLATLSHPGVVRYIDSGATAEAEPYLVMEWLEGETLSARLQRASITLAEILTLGQRVASALAAIHRRGVVHRDIKPSNLFLRGRAIEEVMLIDFGAARRPVAEPTLTITGTMLGTPGYIAPEQVYNLPSLDGRADIFSLGCVLYRCLAGRAPFLGPDALRMLLHGISDELPRLRELRPSIPRELDDLVARLLSRSPDDRPHGADAVAAALLAIEESEPAPLTPRSGPRSVVSEIMSAERRLVSLVMARPADRRSDRSLHAARKGLEQDREIRAAVARHRGRVEIFADGSLLVNLSGADAATDLAVRAARCALAIQRLLEGGSVAVVTGREVLGPSLYESALLDRAMELLESTPKGSAVRLDELTSALLDDRFDTGSTGLFLRGELRDPGPPRADSGERVPCAGRDQELARLEAIFDHCVEERAAGMVLLTAPAGAGKSCLGQQLLRRLRARGQPLEIWLGEAGTLAPGAASGLVEELLRNAVGLRADDPLEVRRQKIRASVERLAAGRAGHLAELLGEVLGASPESEDGRPPGAAREGGELRGEPMEAAFLGLLRAACAEQPVVLVLEDLHAGDRATIKLVDAALGELSDRPLMVLALARPEMHEIFPQLWAESSVQELRLRKLSRRASERLVRQVLGDTVGDETVRTLVARSEGYASYLEEMIRAVAEGKGTATPPAVLAMVAARLEKLDPAARRVLRAASVFGEVFWRGAVEALLGGGDTAAWLSELVEQDVLSIHDGGRFPAETEYRFRSALMQEAAYGMLTEGDQVAGHWLAGQWLEQAGEPDALVLEDHFERCGRGGEPSSGL